MGFVSFTFEMTARKGTLAFVAVSKTARARSLVLSRSEDPRHQPRQHVHDASTAASAVYAYDAFLDSSRGRQQCADPGHQLRAIFGHLTLLQRLSGASPGAVLTWLPTWPGHAGCSGMTNDCMLGAAVPALNVLVAWSSSVVDSSWPHLAAVRGYGHQGSAPDRPARSWSAQAQQRTAHQRLRTTNTRRCKVHARGEGGRCPVLVQL